MNGSAARNPAGGSSTVVTTPWGVWAEFAAAGPKLTTASKALVSATNSGMECRRNMITPPRRPWLKVRQDVVCKAHGDG
jgi:hypothetical protein